MFQSEALLFMTFGTHITAFEGVNTETNCYVEFRSI